MSQSVICTGRKSFWKSVTYILGMQPLKAHFSEILNSYILLDVDPGVDERSLHGTEMQYEVQRGTVYTTLLDTYFS